MEININKNNFLKILSNIQGIVEKKHTLPILANVLIDAEDDVIKLSATDLEIGLESYSDADIISSGKITVPAKKLFEIIKELPDKNINIKKKDNFWIEIKCDKSVFNLVGLSPDEYPKIPEIENTYSYINKNLVDEMIEKTIFSISTDETKFNLTGVYVVSENIDNSYYLNFISTDGHRLSMIKRQIEDEKNNFFNGYILPRKGILELKKIIDNMEENLKINVHDNNFFIKDEKIKLVMRMIDGEFPDYKRVIPEKGNNSAIINRLEFLNTLKRISILSNEKSKGVRLNLEKDKIIIKSSNPDLGDAQEELAIDYMGDNISIGFNAKYIIDTLSVLNNDNVILNLKDNISPGRITPEGDDNYLSVIMPMRL